MIAATWNRASTLAMACIIAVFPVPASAEVQIDLKGPTLTLDEQGVASVTFADGSSLPGDGKPGFELVQGTTTIPVSNLQYNGKTLWVGFAQGSSATFLVTASDGFALFKLTNLAVPKETTMIRLFRLSVPGSAQISELSNSATVGKNFVTVQACEPNVRAIPGTMAPSQGDRQGGSQLFELTKESKVGAQAVRYSATSTDAPGGWSVRGKLFDVSHNLTGAEALQAWVYGDGQGQLLKLQLIDRLGNYCDTVQKIDFQGWRQLTFPLRPNGPFDASHVTTLNLYYNNLPAGKTATCLIDQIEAIGAGNDRVVLEDFEARTLGHWSRRRRDLGVDVQAKYGLKPAAFAVMACAQEDFSKVMQNLEQTAGLPSPTLDGVWNKDAPWTKESYLFLTNFGASQFDEALKIARQGGFKTVLLGQESWCEATGHYEIHKKNFPGGLKDLKRTVRQFQEAGIRVGLHFLAPSVYPPDRYLTPIPDKRLAKGASARLAAAVKPTDTFLPLQELPEDFPEVDGGYSGKGMVVQAGSELIQYQSISKTPPYGLQNCTRGHLGTKVAAHPRGATVRHLSRTYGYHLFDLETNLPEEAAAKFAAVADGCDIDMVYFDGAENMQGEHWQTNARLLKAFYDKLRNKDRLFQASSFSHYSWHMLARSASADGHGDLKGYLDERVPAFLNFARQRMPLDIGWYYGYDPLSTLDQYEYILGQTLAYDSSMSFQVSVPAAQSHPFMPEILDLISRYETLRLSGQIPQDVKEALRAAPELIGKKVDDQQPFLKHRREYRLVQSDGQEAFQRVIYGAWQELQGSEAGAATFSVETPLPARVGLHVHVLSGALNNAGPSYQANDAVLLESFDDLSPWASRPRGAGVMAIEQGQAGSTSPGVQQRIALRPGGKAGNSYAVYSSESRLPGATGWSVFGRQFSPPLNLADHKAIGFWLEGDGQGGLFKLQLGDGKNVMDYYIKNDYSGWRYQQLERPQTDRIDYRSVASLMLYYNEIPAGATLNCGVDDIKALRRIDRPAISNPWIEAAGIRLQVSEQTAAGQYLFAWPGERPRLFPAERPVDATVLPEVSLPAGSHKVRFGCENPDQVKIRVRIVLEPDERLKLNTATE